MLIDDLKPGHGMQRDFATLIETLELASSVQGLLIHDNQNILFCNQIFTKQLGLSVDEVVTGQTLDDYIRQLARNGLYGHDIEPEDRIRQYRQHMTGQFRGREILRPTSKTWSQINYEATKQGLYIVSSLDVTDKMRQKQTIDTPVVAQPGRVDPSSENIGHPAENTIEQKSNEASVLVLAHSLKAAQTHNAIFRRIGFESCATHKLNEAEQMIVAMAKMGRPISVVLLDFGTQNAELSKKLEGLALANKPLIMCMNESEKSDIVGDAHQQLAQYQEVIKALGKPRRGNKMSDLGVQNNAQCEVKPETTAQIGTDQNESASHISRSDSSPRVDVLIVDDNPTSRLIMKQLLLDIGVNFEIARNGKEGLKKWETLKPRLAFIDTFMPELDGYDLIRQIRGTEENLNHKSQICAMIAHPHEGDREKCAEVGADSYLLKPIGPKALEAKLNDMLPNVCAEQDMTARI